MLKLIAIAGFVLAVADLPVQQQTKFQLVIKPEDRQDIRPYGASNPRGRCRPGDRMGHVFAAPHFVPYGTVLPIRRQSTLIPGDWFVLCHF
jgi:hypothetical protein